MLWLMVPSKGLGLLILFSYIDVSICNEDDLVSFIENIPKLSAMPKEKPIIVQFDTDLNNVLEIDQSVNLVNIATYFTLTWKHANIEWNPKDYNNIEHIIIDASLFWIPELHFYYSSENSPTIQPWANYVTVHYTGKISKRFAFNGKTYCPIDVKRFPFDRHHCDFMFGDWVYRNQTIQFELVGNGTVNLENLLDNQEWYLLNAKTFVESLDSFSIIRLHIHLRRESFYYIFNLVIPATLMTLTAVFGFHAPQKSDGKRESKAQLGICTLMPMGVLLLTVMGNMPKFSTTSVPGKRGSFSGLPLLALYYLGLLSVISIGTWVTMLFVILEQYAIDNPTRPPKWLRCICCACSNIPNPGDGRKTFWNKLGFGQKSTNDELEIDINGEPMLPVPKVSRKHSMKMSVADLMPDEWKSVINNLTKISLFFHLLVIAVLILFLFRPDWYAPDHISG